MKAQTIAPLQNVWNDCLKSLGREVHVIWLFTYYDLSSTLIPAMLFLIGALHSDPQPFQATAILVARGLIYFFLYIFTFCVSNQLIGIEEDRLNKPHRPLVTGMVTSRGGMVRWLFGMALFTLAGWLFGVLEWTLLWQVTMIVNNFGGMSKSWVGKHLTISLGTLAMMASAWQIITPVTAIAWQWIILTTLALFPLIAVQDLRDMDGDRAIGRKTLPILFGEWPVRIMLGLGFGSLPILIHFGMMLPAGFTLGTFVCDVGIAVTCLTIATRVVLFRTQAADHRTYMIFTYWYCFLLASAIIAL